MKLAGLVSPASVSVSSEMETNISGIRVARSYLQVMRIEEFDPFH